MALGHFLLCSHNFMVTALGLYVKWPLVMEYKTNTRVQAQEGAGGGMGMARPPKCGRWVYPPDFRLN